MRGDYIVARRLIHLAQQQNRAADRAEVARRITRAAVAGKPLDALADQLTSELNGGQHTMQEPDKAASPESWTQLENWILKTSLARIAAVRPGLATTIGTALKGDDSDLQRLAGLIPPDDGMLAANVIAGVMNEASKRYAGPGMLPA